MMRQATFAIPELVNASANFDLSSNSQSVLSVLAGD